LAGSDVLYSHVVRDYLLHAADQESVNVSWSQSILDEVTEHLMANTRGFTRESANALLRALAETFPDAMAEPSEADYARIPDTPLPDEDDRHVIAAALAADAAIICTANTKHFPAGMMRQLGLTVMTADELFTQLILTHMLEMVAAHRAAVAAFTHATDATTMDALQRAGAPRTADLMTRVLGIS